MHNPMAMHKLTAAKSMTDDFFLDPGSQHNFCPQCLVREVREVRQLPNGSGPENKRREKQSGQGPREKSGRSPSGDVLAVVHKVREQQQPEGGGQEQAESGSGQ
jgi:hypothetical protein